MKYPAIYSDKPQLIETQVEIDRTKDGKYICTLVDYFLEHDTKRLQLPQTSDSYEEAHGYGFGWIEESKKPISEGFKNGV